MENLKHFAAFAALCVWAFNLIGSTAYLFFYGQPQFAIANLIVSAFAFPFIKKQFRILIPAS